MNETDDEGSNGQQDNSNAEEVDEENDDALSTGGVAKIAEEERIEQRLDLEENRKTKADNLNRDSAPGAIAGLLPT